MIIGEAINTRNNRLIHETLNPVLHPAIEDYVATTPHECLGIWNSAFEQLYGEGVTLPTLLSDDDTRELLNMVLTQSESSQLGLDTTEYAKLLETVALASMPDNGFANYPMSKRTRTGGSERALYFRCISILSSLAEATPGIRGVREDLLNTDANALKKYLAATIKAHSAQASLIQLIEMDEHDIRRQKAGLQRTFNDEDRDHDDSFEELLHVLEWRIFSEDNDPRSKHARIKRIIQEQSQTIRQRRRLETDWCPERLDFLIEIAEAAKEQGRNPTMFISNRFEEGAGVYVGVELDSVYDQSKKILFADNPLAGNALYIVDEVQLENEGRPNSWRNVLGANRRTARERGAMRRYHTKNWQAILPTILQIGEAPLPKLPEQLANSSQNDDDLIMSSRALQLRLRTLLRNPSRS